MISKQQAVKEKQPQVMYRIKSTPLFFAFSRFRREIKLLITQVIGLEVQ